MIVEKINDFIQSIKALRINQDTHTIGLVQKRLNELIPERTCEEFIYTNNTDNLPFGCIVIPANSSRAKIAAHELLTDNDTVFINEYYVELDSKLFLYGLDDEEISSIIVYNILKFTSPEAIEFLRNVINKYFMENNTYLKIRQSIQYEEILEFGIIDTLIKLTNALYVESDVVSDAELDSLRLGNSFTSGLCKMKCKIPTTDNTASNLPKLILLDWCFRLYNNVEMNRIPSLTILRDSLDITGSVLEKKMINRIINALNRLDTDSYVIESVLESTMKRRSFLSNIKYNGMRAIEDDFYELLILAKNASNEYEVMYALKQINARLTIIDDYIRNTEMDEVEKGRWVSLYTKYIELRDDIAKKKVYNKKSYGVFVDYNSLDNDYDSDEE